MNPEDDPDVGEPVDPSVWAGLPATRWPTPDPLLDVLDEAEDFNERSHQGQFYVGWRRAIAHLRAALASEEK